jgi:signal peptidase II
VGILTALHRFDRRRGGWFAALVAAGLTADQASKAGIRASLRLGEAREAAGPLVLRHVENPGIALGVVRAGETVPVLIVGVIAGLVAVFLAWGAMHRLFVVGSALATAGCLGNLLDRVLRGQVTDFASVGTLPIFNLADLLIMSGFSLLLAATVRADLGEPMRRLAHRQGPPDLPGGLVVVNLEELDLGRQIDACSLHARPDLLLREPIEGRPVLPDVRDPDPVVGLGDPMEEAA